MALILILLLAVLLFGSGADDLPSRTHPAARRPTRSAYTYEDDEDEEDDFYLMMVAMDEDEEDEFF